MDDDHFKVLSGAEVQERYESLSFDDFRRPIDLEDVPLELQHLIPMAEYWGISDDVMRWKLVKSSSKESLDELKQVIASVEIELEKWLAGPAASAPIITNAYVAFTTMWMAADEG